MKGEALEASYQGQGRCYTGAKVRVEVSLTASDQEPLSRVFCGEHAPPFVVAGCPKQKYGAPKHLAWPPAMLKGLTDIWGLPVLTQAMNDENQYVRKAATDLLEEMGPLAKEAIPSLIQLLEYRGDMGRVWNAAKALRAITGQDFSTDADRWQEWWAKQQ